MVSEIRLEAMPAETRGEARSEGSAALAPSSEDSLTLRFAISTPDALALEALRHARRSILREEWTLGRDPGEPSLESAVFTPTEVVWNVPLALRGRCEQTLQHLESRANRTLRELRRS
jgi:hypothetical protein